MWHLLEKISEQVTKYSTVVGQVWYLLVFLFRLIVVVTIGGAVYGDEQSAFKCSTQEPGCTNMCYNEFSKISHIRFWAFQLLGVATPVVIFHFYSMRVAGQIEKLRNEEAAIKAEEGEMIDLLDDPRLGRDFKKMARRRQSIGHVKVKKVYTSGDLKEVPLTNKIHYAYFISIVAKLVIEAVFLWLAYEVFKFMDLSASSDNGAWDFIWIRVPAMFSCKASPEVEAACHQAVGLNKQGHVPCWVSRPMEKTIFIRYMNVLSAICFVLCAIELIYLAIRGLVKKMDKRKPHKSMMNGHPRNGQFGHRKDSVFYATAPDSYHLQNDNLYPTLAVPVKLGSSEVRQFQAYEEAKRSRKEGADK